MAVGDTLSHDEGYTWLVASSGGPGTFFDRLADYENTPPLYYLLTWPLPDDGVAWLRIVSVLAGVGCVAAVWWVVDGIRKNLTAHSVANFLGAPWIAAGAMAVAPFAVSYSDYARGFVLADLGLLVALGAAIRKQWWLYVLGAAVALYAEYDSALFLIALSFVAGWRALLPLALLVPWLPFVSDTDTKAAPIYPDPSPASLRDTIVRLTFGEHGTANATTLRWLQFVLVAAVAVWAFKKAPRIIWVTAAGTLVLHAITHWVGPDIFAPRYLTELIPLGAIALGCALTTRQLQTAAAVGIALLGTAVVVRRAQGSDEPDYKAIARVIAPTAEGRTVLTNSAVIAYYMRDLRPHLDRPFGLEAPCAGCSPPFLIVEDARVANSPRPGTGSARTFGPVYVRK
ncbi:MAG TPA: hypothetical protein VFN64_07470 [Burkholderiaceae bacterium]|nr:hypothetical protein [Burkholderiaceae bacterium]